MMKLLRNHKDLRFKIISVLVLFTLCFIVITTMNLIQHQNEILDNQKIYLEDMRSQSLTELNISIESDSSQVENECERVLRSQMKLQLNSAAYLINTELESDDSMERFLNDQDYRRQLIDRITSTLKVHNESSQLFVINHDGGYETSSESSLKYPHTMSKKLILNIPNRLKTIKDDLVWQDELRYILEKSGIIKDSHQYDDYTVCSLKELDLDTYDYDELLEVSSYGYKELVYIKEKYPELYDKLLMFKIVTHKDILQASRLSSILAKDHMDTTDLWYDDLSGNKYLIEYVTIPIGPDGFDHEPYYEDGSMNKKYLKLTLMITADYTSYSSHHREFIDSVNDSIEIYESQYDVISNRELQFINNRKSSGRLQIVLLSLSFVMFLLLSVYVITLSHKKQ